MLGGTLDFVVLGRGATLSKLDSPAAASLVFHGAYISRPRDPAAARTPFATIRGTLRRKPDATIVFTLPPGVEIEYAPPPPEQPSTHLNLHFDPVAFENVPPIGSEARSLKLPPRPDDARHFELVTELQIAGDVEATSGANAILDVPLAPLSFFRARLVDKDDQPLSAQPFELDLPDGATVEGETDADGVASINPVMRGELVLRLKVGALR